MPNILISVPTKKVKQPLSVTHPELAKEADGWDPTSITRGSDTKLSWKCTTGHVYIAAVSSRVRGRSCPYCSGRKVQKGLNDLQSEFPELAREAFGWDPSDFTSGSNRKLTWRCTKGHVWEAVIYERARRSSGCPYCSNTKVQPGFNDLAFLFPALAKEADGWDPTNINPGSQKKLAWKCKFGHSWKTSPMHRTRLKQNCPVCVNKKINPGENDLETLFPDIARMADGWDPKIIGSGSHRKMKWKCAKGHSWESTVGDMTSRERSCPFCNNRKLLTGFNDLESRFPDLALQAYGWDPKKIHPGSTAKRKWRCALEHVWTSTVNSRTALGAGCPSCAVGGFDPNSDGYFYLIDHPDWGMLQIGITNFPKDRLTAHRRLGWELIELRGPMEGHLTQQWETAILRMLKAKGTDLSNDKIAGKFDGYSEAWSKSTFEVSSIKELMRLTEEFEKND